TFDDQNKILLGVRYDYNSLHGSILSPRLNYKWNSADKYSTLRLSIGNGYRVANIFTEDHAALTGARAVVCIDHLRPETSWNGNITLVRKFTTGSAYIGIDATAFYTHVNNTNDADYETHPYLIFYPILYGYAVSKGLSLN